MLRRAKQVVYGSAALAAAAISVPLMDAADTDADSMMAGHGLDVAFLAPSLSLRDVRTTDLMYEYAVLRAVSTPWLASTGMAVAKVLPLVARLTVYPFFCAGEDVAGSLTTVRENSRHGVGSVLNLSAEDARSDGDAERHLLSMVEAVRTGEPGVKFGAVKVSALESPPFLARYAAALAPGGAALSEDDLGRLDRLVARLQVLIEAAASRRVRILIDAELSRLQPAVDELALALGRAYNRPGGDASGPPVVYNTYQLYRRDALARLREDAARADREGFAFGAKLVRGAYRMQEPAGVVFDTIDGTHGSYDAGVEFLVERAVQGSGAVFVATHNQVSVTRALERLAAEGVGSEESRDRVSFGQLRGMGNLLSLTLARSGHNVHKYVPYGPIDEVMPYLMRRVEENQELLGSLSGERHLLARELVNRFGLGIMYAS